MSPAWGGFRMYLGWFFALAFFCLTLVIGSSATAQTDVERGADAAQKFCARCHVIGKNEFVGIASTMSFYMMSEHIDRYEVRLRSVTARHPHIALNLDLTADDIEGLIAYIKQLDWKARWKRIMPRK